MDAADEPQEEAQPAEEIHWPGCGLYAGWMLATIFGTGLGWAAGWWVSFRIPGAIATLMIGLLTGLILGGLQWLVLRAYLRRAALWIPLTGIGWGGGFFTGSLIANLLGLGEAWLGLAAGAASGAFTGVLQWLLLRGQVTRAGLWVAASTAGWASGLLYFRPGVTGSGFFYGALGGIVTGLALVWLFQRPEEDKI